jgi:hypothetical protein
MHGMYCQNTSTMETILPVIEFHQWIQSKDQELASKIKYSRHLYIVPREYGYILINDWISRIEEIRRIKIKTEKMKIVYETSEGKRKKYSYKVLFASHRINNNIYTSPETRCSQCSVRRDLSKNIL